MSRRPKVVVCVSTYQHAPFIEACLASVAVQRGDFELQVLVGDDGSTDGTTEICQRFGDDPRFDLRITRDRSRVIRIGGRATGRRNITDLLARADGDYVAHLDGDDRWCDASKLERQVAALEADPSATASFHATRVMVGAETLRVIGAGASTRVHLGELLRQNPVRPSAMIYRRRVVPNPLPRWMVHEAPALDLPLQVGAACRGALLKVPGVASIYNRHDGGVWSARQLGGVSRDAALLVELVAEHFPPARAYLAGVASRRRVQAAVAYWRSGKPEQAAEMVALARPLELLGQPKYLAGFVGVRAAHAIGAMRGQ